MEDPRSTDEFIARFENSFIRELSKCKIAPNDEFYLMKLKNGRVLSDYEIAVAKYAFKTFGRNKAILEVGCGTGQLALLMGAMGMRMQAVEASERVNHAIRIRAAISTEYPSAAATEIHKGQYPLSIAPPHDVLIATNVVNGFWLSWQEPEESKLRRMLSADDAVIDLELWWTVRSSIADQNKLLCHITYCTGMKTVAMITRSTVHLHKSRAV